MKNLTTPQVILISFFLIAVSIASLPYLNLIHYFEYIMKNTLSILGLSTSVGVFIVSYLVYKRDIPSLDTQINIIPDENNDLVSQLKNTGTMPQSSTADFFICFQIANSGFRTITAIFLTNEKDETIIPLFCKGVDGYTLAEGGKASGILDLSKNGVSLLKNAKKLYIKDTAQRKHLVKNNSWKKEFNN